MSSVVKWMKHVVLLAGLLGVLGFVLPFYSYQGLAASPYRILTAEPQDFADRTDRARYRALYELLTESQLSSRWDDPVAVAWSTHSTDRPPVVPYFYVAAVLMVLIGLGALIVGRLGFIAALFSLAAAMFAIGGWIRELRWYRDILRAGHDATLTGASTLLLVSGLIALAASLVALIGRDPGRPAKKRVIEIPVARVVRS